MYVHWLIQVFMRTRTSAPRPISHSFISYHVDLFGVVFTFECLICETTICAVQTVPDNTGFVTVARNP